MNGRGIIGVNSRDIVNVCVRASFSELNYLQFCIDGNLIDNAASHWLISVSTIANYTFQSSLANHRPMQNTIASNTFSAYNNTAWWTFYDSIIHLIALKASKNRLRFHGDIIPSNCICIDLYNAVSFKNDLYVPIDLLVLDGNAFSETAS